MVLIESVEKTTLIEGASACCKGSTILLKECKNRKISSL